jgi:hypothetical protein
MLARRAPRSNGGSGGKVGGGKLGRRSALRASQRHLPPACKQLRGLAEPAETPGGKPEVGLPVQCPQRAALRPIMLASCVWGV